MWVKRFVGTPRGIVQQMKSFRFNPPVFEPQPAQCWALGGAFGPVVRAGGDINDIWSIIETADRLDVASRIGARFGEDELSAALGRDVARELKGRAYETAAQCLKVRALARTVGEVVAGVGVDAVVLKGGALLLLDAAIPGARNVGDLDVLVKRAEAGRVQQALVERGWRAADLPPSRHQLPILSHPSGVCVEVHVEVPGVRLARRTATFEDVIEAGLVIEGSDDRRRIHVAARRLLVAHLLVHGVHQHGLAPSAYPMPRLIADIQDLVADQEEWDAFMRSGFGWVEHAVSRREAEAVWRVADGLRQGTDPAELLGGDDDEARLLRHIVAGLFDDGYRESLRVRNLHRAARDGSVAGLAGKAVFLTRGQVDAIYGRPASELGYLGRRLWRPFDLVVRAIGYARASAVQWARRLGSGK